MPSSVLILLFVTLVCGTAFPLLKSAAADLNDVEISAFRFLIATVCIAPFLLKAPRHAWTDGLLPGGLGLASYVAQGTGCSISRRTAARFSPA